MENDWLGAYVTWLWGGIHGSLSEEVTVKMANEGIGKNRRQQVKSP
jgi:hypothetical protein